MAPPSAVFAGIKETISKINKEKIPTKQPRKVLKYLNALIYERKKERFLYF